MIIEFADPGLNGALLFVPLAAFIIGLSMFILPFRLTEREGLWPLPGFLISIAAGVLALTLSPSDYSNQVDFETIEQLKSEGFSNIDLSGDRFTAATPDGEYFSGILVDLRPNSGYAYQVLEITDTPTK